MYSDTLSSFCSSNFVLSAPFIQAPRLKQGSQAVPETLASFLHSIYWTSLSLHWAWMVTSCQKGREEGGKEERQADGGGTQVVPTPCFFVPLCWTNIYRLWSFCLFTQDAICCPFNKNLQVSNWTRASGGARRKEGRADKKFGFPSFCCVLPCSKSKETHKNPKGKSAFSSSDFSPLVLGLPQTLTLTVEVMSFL